MSRTLVFHIIGTIVLLGAVLAFSIGAFMLGRVIQANGNIYDVELFLGLGFALIFGAALGVYFIISTWRKPQEEVDATLLDFSEVNQGKTKLKPIQGIAGLALLAGLAGLLIPFGIAVEDVYKGRGSTEDLLVTTIIALYILCGVVYTLAVFFNLRHSR